MAETTSRAVARYDGPRTTADLEKYAQLLAVNTTPDGRSWRNEALPATFRGNPASVAFAVEYAKALDISPVTAIIGIHIVDGKPTASAGLISALVRRAGHKIRTWLEGSVEEGTAKGITTIVREDDPDFTYRSEWTLARAVRAGLCSLSQDPKSGVWTVSAKGRSGKPGAWETYTENMLKSRSITEVSRDAAEDAILGVHYTPEELGAEVDENGDVVYTVTRVDAPAPEAAPATAPTPSKDEDIHDADVVEEDTGPDLVAIAATCRERILAARDADSLVAVWNDPELIARETSRAQLLETADVDGNPVSVFDLFRSAGDAIKAGSYLTAGTRYDDPQDDDGDASEGPGDGGPDDDPKTPENGDSGREITVDEAIAKADDVVDAEVVEDTRTEREKLDAVMNGLDRGQVGEIVEWCRSNGLNPANGEGACREIREAIESGDAFSDATLAALPDDPKALVERILGGTVIEETRVTDPAEMHRRELAERQAENREEARRDSLPAGAGPRGSGRDAFKAARATRAKS